MDTASFTLPLTGDVKGKTMAEKEYKSADLYRKMQAYSSAVVYFDSILNNYYDTEYVESSLYWKGECLVKLNRHEEAFEALQQYVSRYPDARFVARAKSQIIKLQAVITETRETNGASP